MAQTTDVEVTPPRRTALETTTIERLIWIELEEMPRLRSALSEWADDPYLALQLHRLEREAARMRATLGSSGRGLLRLR